MLLHLENGENIFAIFSLMKNFGSVLKQFIKRLFSSTTSPKPDMPQHKGIIAFDIASQKILWTNNEFCLFFLQATIKFMDSNKDLKKVISMHLDYFSGELIKEFGNDHKKINTLQKSSGRMKKIGVRIFIPKFFK